MPLPHRASSLDPLSIVQSSFLLAIMTPHKSQTGFLLTFQAFPAESGASAYNLEPLHLDELEGDSPKEITQQLQHNVTGDSILRTSISPLSTSQDQR